MRDWHQVNLCREAEAQLRIIATIRATTEIWNPMWPGMEMGVTARECLLVLTSGEDQATVPPLKMFGAGHSEVGVEAGAGAGAGRSLSRSRSPVRGIRRESGFHDRSRSRGASTQLCRDFTAGRCRRGNHCHFLHQGNQHHEDNWESRHRKDGDSKYSTTHDTRDYTSRIGRSTPYCTDFVRGKCRRGASCRYSHDGASDSFDKVSGNDAIRERENRRNRDASFERGVDPEHRRGGDVPCKFFAAGNCRNGKYCRFSHHSHSDLSPDGRSRGDRWGLGRNSDDVDRLWDGPKLSEWSNTANVSDTTKSEDKSGKLGAPVARLTRWSIDDTRWGHDMDKEKKNCGDPAVDKAVENNEKAGHLWMEESAGASIGISESRGAEKWLGDMDMSPDWNYGVQSAKHAVKGEHGQITQAPQSLGSYDPSLMARGQDITKEASVQFHGAAAAVQPIINEKSYFQPNHNLMGDGANVVSCDDKIAVEKTVSSSADLNISANIIPGQCFNQNGRSLSSLPLSNVIAVGQNQVVTPNAPLRGGAMKYQQNLAFSSEGKPIIQPDIGDDSALQVNPGIPPSQNMVSGEQLTKLTNLSASLAQFFGDRKQLPQLYAALNSHNSSDIPSFTISEVPIQPVLAAHVQTDQAIKSQQYDPICDGVESKNPGSSNNPPGLKSNSLGLKSPVDGIPELPLKNLSPSSFPVGPNGTDLPRTGSSEEPNHKSQQSNKLDMGAHGEAMENNEEGIEERKQAQEGNQKDQDDGPLGNADGDAGEDEGKKSKDVKAIRAFKFALVEFVKELLKPTWKEGQISKDAYKTIVKKVVDKVTGGQGANIPQTQEKIDHYLSSSKPKLTKLVQVSAGLLTCSIFNGSPSIILSRIH
ncbi:hypothetical protein I3760_03G122500 [Carya illinoinensis]|nr:hypothetical protein I3760_03G122500 [Carya illinoinensis]